MKLPFTILGIDIAKTYTGMAVVNRDLKIIDKHTIKINKSIIKKHNDIYWMYYLRDQVSKFVALHTPDLVVIESNYLSRNVKTMATLNQALTCAIFACENYVFTTLTPSEARRRALGTNCKKEEVAFLLKLKHNIDPTKFNEHELDAIILALACLEGDAF